MTDADKLAAIRRILALEEIPNQDEPNVVKGYTHEYSSVCPFNCDNTALLLQKPGGEVWIFYADGAGGWALPSPINHASQCRWDRKNPRRLYYIYLNELRWFDTGDFANWGIVRKFSEFPNVSGMGESDISQDGDHFVLCSGRNIFVYEVSTDRKLLEAGWPSPFTDLYVTPDNNILVSEPDGVYLRAGTVISKGRLTPKRGHMDVTRDSNGDECLIWANADEKDHLAGFPNGIIKIRLADGTQTGLLSLGWSPKGGPESMACHISCQDNGPALVSTYGKDPDVQYSNELLLVALDGSGLQHYFGKHGSDASDYSGQPKASVSHDGSRFVYTANGDAHIQVIA